MPASKPVSSAGVYAERKPSRGQVARNSSSAAQQQRRHAGRKDKRDERKVPRLQRDARKGQEERGRQRHVDDQPLHPSDRSLWQKAGSPEERAKQDEQEDRQDFGERGENRHDNNFQDGRWSKYSRRRESKPKPTDSSRSLIESKNARACPSPTCKAGFDESIRPK